MKFSESLKKSKDFQNVYNKGNSYANRLLVMYVLENHTDKNRLGISVSKKVGNSVIRTSFDPSDPRGVPATGGHVQ